MKTVALQVRSYIEARLGNCLLVLWTAQKICVPKVGFAIQYLLVIELIINY